MSAPVEELRARLAAALDGGPAVFALPPDPAEAASVSAALRPDLPLEVDDVAVVLATSGSTGEPKGVLLSAAALRFQAERAHERLSGPGTWVVAMPTWHVGGLQVLVRSVVARTPAIAATWETLGSVERPSDGPLYVSVVPTQLVRALDAGIDLSHFDAILVGGAACPPALVRRALSAGARVVQSYGMSETCGGCVYDGWPLDGVEVTLRPADDRVLVRGPLLFSGYRLRPDLYAAAVTDGWYVSNDVGRYGVDGRLEILGRADDVIVTGGEKVAPLAVEHRLLSHPSVAAAAVVGVDDPEWGQRVVAYVVLQSPVVDDELRTWVRSSLGRAAAPRSVLVVDALPLLASGKPDRLALVAMSSGA